MPFEIIMQHCLTHLSSHQVMLIGGIKLIKMKQTFTIPIKHLFMTFWSTLGPVDLRCQLVEQTMVAQVLQTKMISIGQSFLEVYSLLMVIHS